MKRIILFVGILISSLSVSAADQCASWGCQSTIDTLYVNADGLIYVGTPLDETIADCTPVSNVFFSINPSSNANAKEMYSTLLAAYMSKSKIRLRVKSGHAQCELSYIELSAGL